MELSIASLPPPAFSTTNRLKHMMKKTIVTCTARRCPQHYHILLPPCRAYGDNNNSNLVFQPRIAISSGRKVFPWVKASECDPVGQPDSLLTRILKFSDIVQRFFVAYVFNMTIAAFVGILGRTWVEEAHLVLLPKWTILLRAVLFLISLLGVNAFVNGVNQIYDIEIDKINKPYKPLASGELSLQLGWILAMSSLATSIAIPLILKSASVLAFNLCLSLLGLLYSVPPFSTKRSTIGAILTISFATGVIGTLGTSAAVRATLGLPFRLSPAIIFMVTFRALWFLVCGAIKDIPDLEGDTKFDVPTLASIYGPRRVALVGFGLQLLVYIAAITMAILMPQVFKRSVMIPAHIILALYLSFQAWKLEKANYTKEESQSSLLSSFILLNIEVLILPFF